MIKSLKAAETYMHTHTGKSLIGKKLFILSIMAMICVNDLYATGNCGISSLNVSVRDSKKRGYTNLDGTTGSGEAAYGLTTGSGEWATVFSYGVVWGMGNCNNTEGTAFNTPDTPNTSVVGKHCWCQVTGFSPSGSDYTQGPQCTTTPSSTWLYTDISTDTATCLAQCAYRCTGIMGQYNSQLRGPLYAAVPLDIVDLAWYDNGNTISGPQSCTVGGTFVPTTPPARTGYVFAGWKAHSAGECGIWKLDTSTNGTAYGYKNDSTGAWGSDSSNTSNYGITTDNTWATEFSYGTVWGKARCSTTSGDNHNWRWGAPSSDWTGSPAQESNGTNCWCQVTGFTSSGNSYTSGPQCTTTASSSWVFNFAGGPAALCANSCALNCADYVRSNASFRTAIFGAVGQ